MSVTSTSSSEVSMAKSYWFHKMSNNKIHLSLQTSYLHPRGINHLLRLKSQVGIEWLTSWNPSRVLI